MLDVTLDFRGQARYRFEGRARRPRTEEGLASLCRRLGVTELRLPAEPRWPLSLAVSVAGVAGETLPPTVAVVCLDGTRLVLSERLGAAGWSYFVAAVARRLQSQPVASSGTPDGASPPSTPRSAEAKSRTVPSGDRTTTQAGQPHATEPAGGPVSPAVRASDGSTASDDEAAARTSAGSAGPADDGGDGGRSRA